MSESFMQRLIHSSSRIFNRSKKDDLVPTQMYSWTLSPSWNRSSRVPYSGRSLADTIYNQISLDVASIPLRHVRVDKNDKFLEYLDSGLNECLESSANVDQTGRSFIQDLVLTMIEDGVAAVVAVDTDVELNDRGSFDVLTMRVGRIVEFFPKHVKVSVYNDQNGRSEEVILSKAETAVIVNPHYQVMNQQNSTLSRLTNKLSLLDEFDDRTISGKLDVILQLPYSVRTETLRDKAQQRVKELENQLQNGAYGIAYADSAERITQLNRPAENNLLEQIKYLTSELFNRLGLTEEVFKGTADEQTMLAYYNRTIEPILSVITDSLTRTFLTKTARTQGQRVISIRDPFKTVPVTQFASIADVFVRNEILSSNEVRAVIGYPPVNDPKADQLRNSNINPVEAPVENFPTNTPPDSLDNQVGETTDER